MRIWLWLWLVVRCAAPLWAEPDFKPLVTRGRPGRLEAWQEDEKLHLRLGSAWSVAFPDTVVHGQAYLLSGNRVVLNFFKYHWTDQRLVMLGPGGDLLRSRKVVFDTSARPRLFYSGGSDLRWLSQDGRRAWVQEYNQLVLIDLETGATLPLQPAVQSEFWNPAADTSCLLRLALFLGQQPPSSLLRRADPEARYLQAGWRARRGDREALRWLRNAQAAGQSGALEGLALLGPEAVEADILNNLRQPDGWVSALDRLGDHGHPIIRKALLKATRMPREPQLDRTLEEAAQGQDASFWEPVLRFAEARRGFAGLWTLANLNVPDRDRLLLQFLEEERFRNDAALEHYFCHQPCPEVCAVALKLLKKHPEDFKWVRILRFQTRVDLGLDSAAWERWLTQGFRQPAEVKARILRECNEPTALLWEAQLGQLKPEELSRLPRLQAIWPITGQLAPDGRLLLGRGYSWMAESNSAPRALMIGDQAWDPRTGRVLTQDYLVTTDGRFRWNRREKHIVDSQSGRRFLWPGRPSEVYPGRAECFGPQDLMRFDPGRQSFHPAGWRSLESPSRSEFAELVKNELTLTDWSRGGVILRKSLSWNPDDLFFSSDGDWMLLTGAERWELWDRRGNRVAGESGRKATLSPDRSCLVDFHEGKLRLHRLSQAGGNRVERRWPEESIGVTFVGRNLVVNGAGTSRLLDTELVDVSSFWDPGGGITATRDGRQFASVSQDSTWVWQSQSTAPSVPAEKQTLLCELWTGMRLQGGMAVPLQSAEFERRRQLWQQDGGGFWFDDPRWHSSDELPWWPILAGMALLAGLLAFMVFERRWRDRAGSDRFSAWAI